MKYDLTAIRPKSLTDASKSSCLPHFKYILASKNGLNFFLYELYRKDVEYRVKVFDEVGSKLLEDDIQSSVSAMMAQGLHQTVLNGPKKLTKALKYKSQREPGIENLRLMRCNLQSLARDPTTYAYMSIKSVNESLW